jgi:hypothetical protein
MKLDFVIASMYTKEARNKSARFLKRKRKWLWASSTSNLDIYTAERKKKQLYYTN